MNLNETEAKELQRLLESVGDLILILAKDPQTTKGLSATKTTFDLAIHARKILQFRDERRRIFDEDLFADPAWDLLLELFISDALGQQASVKAATAGARVPPTTGLRWLNVVEERGLIERRDDPSDARRIYVSLTDLAFTKMRLLLEKGALSPA